MLCLGTGCLKPSPPASTAVQEGVRFPSQRKGSVSTFLRETHPLLGQGCQDGTPSLTRPRHARNCDWAPSHGMREPGRGAGCGEEQKQGPISPPAPPKLGLHFPSLGSSWVSCCACDTGWLCRGPQTALSHPIGSGGGLISPFFFFVFTGRINNCPFPRC